MSEQEIQQAFIDKLLSLVSDIKADRVQVATMAIIMEADKTTYSIKTTPVFKEE